MRILILGGDGMLGHQLLKHFSSRAEVRVTLRRPLSSYSKFGLFNINNSFDEVEATDLQKISNLINTFDPQAIINCIGIVKQRHEAKEVIPSLEINSLLPHKLAVICQKKKIRFIHISTDCVFSGKKGNYSEDDFSDAEDIYGKTKYLGEVSEPGCITLRTSIIGLELARNKSLIEWFLAQKGTILGFTRAIYSGLTTLELARVIELLLTKFLHLSGLWQVSSSPISKYELLKAFSTHLGKTDIEIIPSDNFVCDRSLNSEKFQKETGYRAPTWPKMLDELALQVRDRI